MPRRKPPATARHRSTSSTATVCVNLSSGTTSASEQQHGQSKTSPSTGRSSARSDQNHPIRDMTERSDGTLLHRRLPARVLYLRNFWAPQIPDGRLLLFEI